MDIRKAKKEDTKNIATISLCVWIDTYAINGVRENISKYVLSTFNESTIETMINEQQVYVAENTDHILGYIALNSDNNTKHEIKNLYILPKLQKNNIGRKLIEKVSAIFNGVLWLSCWEENTNAIGFYKALGFIEVGENYFELGVDKYRNVLFELST